MRHTNIFILTLLFALSAPLTTASAQKHVVTRSTAKPKAGTSAGTAKKATAPRRTVPSSARTGSTAFPSEFWANGLYYKVMSMQDRTCEVAQHYEYTGDIQIPRQVTYKGRTFTVTTIGREAFRDCESLTSITIPSSVTTIGDYAFVFCKSLTSITIPSSVTTIGGGAFEYCERLTGITIPYSVTTIGQVAFYGCTGLTSVTIPNSVKAIGDCAFYGCESLKSITILNPNTVIGKDAFYGCPAQASIKEVVTSKLTEEKVYQVVDQMPSFPGGDDALDKYISTHLKYPSRALDQGVEGKVVVRFVVTSTGNIGEIQILKSVDTDLDKEAKRVIASLPKFNPGKQQGKPVSVWYSHSIDFRIGNAK